MTMLWRIAEKYLKQFPHKIEACEWHSTERVTFPWGTWLEMQFDTPFRNKVVNFWSRDIDGVFGKYGSFYEARRAATFRRKREVVDIGGEKVHVYASESHPATDKGRLTPTLDLSFGIGASYKPLLAKFGPDENPRCFSLENLQDNLTLTIGRLFLDGEMPAEALLDWVQEVHPRGHQLRRFLSHGSLCLT